MSKEVFMQMRVEPELRASFYEAVAKEHRPAAQVLRELMREYIDSRQKTEKTDTGEILKRFESVKFAAASVSLEGLSVSPEAMAKARSFVEGKIELDELVALRHE